MYASLVLVTNTCVGLPKYIDYSSVTQILTVLPMHMVRSFYIKICTITNLQVIQSFGRLACMQLTVQWCELPMTGRRTYVRVRDVFCGVHVLCMPLRRRCACDMENLSHAHNARRSAEVERKTMVSRARELEHNWLGAKNVAHLVFGFWLAAFLKSVTEC